jgi:hypothetical protein
MNLLWVAFEMVFWMGFVYPVTVIFMDWLLVELIGLVLWAEYMHVILDDLGGTREV